MNPDKPKRIILLASGDLWAGAEAVVYHLAKGLQKEPLIKLMVVLLNKGKLAELCLLEGIDTRVIDETRYSFPQIAWRFATLIKGFRPHIIHSHRYKENLLTTLGRHFRHAPKLVCTVHGFSEGHKKLKTRITSIANNAILRFCFDKIIAVSNDITYRLVRERSFPTHKLVTIHNGIEIPSLRNQFKDNKKEIIIGSAGRLVPVKDYKLMVSIANKICKKDSRVKFILAGEGPEKDNIISRIKDYGLDGKFELLGHVDNMEEFYTTIDIYLNTSIHEGIPVTILEAMAHAIPVIAPNVGGIPEIISHGKTGYLMTTRDPDAIADFINELIQHKENLRTVARISREKIEKDFSLDSMVKAYLSVYENILGYTRRTQ